MSAHLPKDLKFLVCFRKRSSVLNYLTLKLSLVRKRPNFWLKEKTLTSQSELYQLSSSNHQSSKSSSVCSKCDWWSFQPCSSASESLSRTIGFAPSPHFAFRCWSSAATSAKPSKCSARTALSSNVEIPHFISQKLLSCSKSQLQATSELSSRWTLCARQCGIRPRLLKISCWRCFRVGPGACWTNRRGGVLALSTSAKEFR